MVKSTPAPKPRLPKLAILPFIYSIVLVVLIIMQLMGLGGFNFAHIVYRSVGLPSLIVLIAALEVFSLPFLLRLRLSWLARALSALFALVTPIFLLANHLYLLSQGMLNAQPYPVVGFSALVVLGVASFYVLDGPRVWKSSQK